MSTIACPRCGEEVVPEEAGTAACSFCDWRQDEPAKKFENNNSGWHPERNVPSGFARPYVKTPEHEQAIREKYERVDAMRQLASERAAESGRNPDDAPRGVTDLAAHYHPEDAANILDAMRDHSTAATRPPVNDYEIGADS